VKYIDIEVEIEMPTDKTGPQPPPPKGFIGNNALRLNAATINQAVQEYLDRNMITAPRVTSITQDKSVSGGWFDVSVTDLPPSV
jgi:hypothetical protein